MTRSPGLLLIKTSGEVSLAGVAQNGDYGLTFIGWAFGDLQGGIGVGTGRDAYQQTFLQSQLPGSFKGLLVGNGDNLIENIGIQYGRDKSGADSLNFVRAGCVRVLVRVHGLARLQVTDGKGGDPRAAGGPLVG